jgi:hypothetical protein
MTPNVRELKTYIPFEFDPRPVTEPGCAREWRGAAVLRD